MTEAKEAPKFQFEISLSVLNHLGRNLYRNFITVLSEAISNSWDADAKNVWISINRETATFSIKDDGVGMSADDFQNKFLRIGYSKRSSLGLLSPLKRPYIGAKGIGKLALLSCAKRVSILSKRQGEDYIGGVIDNSDLDKAIVEDLTPNQYPLEPVNLELSERLQLDHESGTILIFEGSNAQIRKSAAHLKQLLAMYFQFSTFDPNFAIHVDGQKVTPSDLAPTALKTEFIWNINNFTGDFLGETKNLKAKPIALVSPLELSGFIGTVETPRSLKIDGTDDRVTVDLYVNGRIREKNLLRHIPTQRIVENYIFGQIHFDVMDSGASDPFTSSREGVLENDENFERLLAYMKGVLLPRVFEDWDSLRLERDQSGDDDNPTVSKKDRKSKELVIAAQADFRQQEDSESKPIVDIWQTSLNADASFNVSAYVDCFLSENLIRKYVRHEGIALTPRQQTEAEEWKASEARNKAAANIRFDFHSNADEFSYLGMDTLARIAEGAATGGPRAPLIEDSVLYKPVRNAVGHTSLLTNTGKMHLTLRLENIKARIKELLALVRD